MSAGVLGSALCTGVSTAAAERVARGKSVIYIFLSGGLSQLDSFDLKPNAPSTIRGDFSPIATRTPGVQICEHLPLLAERSHLWSLVRSMSHPSNEHSLGHAMMLTGRTVQTPGFNPNRPMPGDWPTLAAIAGQVVPRRGILPSAIVLPEKLVHSSGRVIPGQFAGMMGPGSDPWFIEASPFRPRTYGAYPEYAFTMEPEGRIVENAPFQSPNLSLPTGMNRNQLHGRFRLRDAVEHERGAAGAFERSRELASALLSEPGLRAAFDVTSADIRVQERYGRNSFGWSLLMARRLVERGVPFVQVNLGNDEAWDLHGSIFPRMRDSLLPPTDLALSALIDDLQQSGQLEDTLIVMAGEFGRTPRLSTLTQHYRQPGRDHWGAVQTVLFAGGGARGGQIIGSSDRDGGQPASQRQTPENLAATIFKALGVPDSTMWYDRLRRPHHVYHAEPFA